MQGSDKNRKYNEKKAFVDIKTNELTDEVLILEAQSSSC